MDVTCWEAGYSEDLFTWGCAMAWNVGRGRAETMCVALAVEKEVLPLCGLR